jgi:hypothetical protein
MSDIKSAHDIKSAELNDGTTVYINGKYLFFIKIFGVILLFLTSNIKHSRL